MSKLAPTTATDRIVELDILRGFALFGIVMVNVQFMGLPFYKVLTDLHPFSDPASIAGRTLITIFFEGKFITLFSFLFGLGFWIFASRARDKGYKAGPLFLRRIFILAIIGAAHAVLFWAGDILLPYAVLGLFLMLFLNRSTKTVKVWMILFPVFQILLMLLLVLLLQIGLSIPEARDAILADFDETRQQMEQMALSANQIYSSSNWIAMIPIRLQELGFAYQGFIFSGMGIFYLMGLFLAGMLAGRNGWFSNLEQKLPKIRKRLPWLLLLGIACAIAKYWLFQQTDLMLPDWSSAGYMIFAIIGSPLLIAAYASLLILGYYRWKDAAFWNYITAAGRMSLTVYLTQTLILTTIFYGYGLGLYGSVPVPGMLLMALGVYALQLVAARWWMQHFYMGPFEWLWRAATYGSASRFRKREE
ncbi:DUF418 domain-containing protein [Balneolales bacterium ANBcel1]|nr:DUF418 domain-containing protein [Balneolales bacterium ANBcel1]